MPGIPAEDTRAVRREAQAKAASARRGAWTLIALVSLAPFAWFYAQNLHEPIRAGDVIGYAIGTVGVGWLLFLVLDLIGPANPARLGAGIAAAVFLFFSYYGFVSLFGLPGEGALRSLTAFAITSVPLILLVAFLAQKSLFRLFLFIFASANLGIPLALILTSDLPDPGPSLPPEQAYPLDGNDIWSGTLVRSPNIYWIVADSYPNAVELFEYYGFDNDLFLDRLEARGFVVARESYSNFSTTLLSVPSTLDMEYSFDEDESIYEAKFGAVWARLPGRTNSGVHASFGGDNRTVSWLRQLGYHYIHFEGQSFLITRCQGEEDLCIRGALAGLTELQYRLLSLTPFRGLFEDWLALSRGRQPRERAASGTGIPELEKSLATLDLAEPFFLYAHIASPHRPYLNDAQCNLLSADYDRRGNRNFINQLQCVNRHLESLVESIVAVDPDAFIVLSSDHGARLSVRKGTALHELSPRQVRESLGILNAFRLPAECTSAIHPRVTPINTMRIVFACLGGEEPQLLEPQHFIVRPDSPQRGHLRRVSVR